MGKSGAERTLAPGTVLWYPRSQENRDTGPREERCQSKWHFFPFSHTVWQSPFMTLQQTESITWTLVTRPPISFFPNKIKTTPKDPFVDLADHPWSIIVWLPLLGPATFYRLWGGPQKHPFFQRSHIPRQILLPPKLRGSGGQASVTAKTVTAPSSPTQRSHIFAPSLSQHLPPSLTWWT